MKKPKQNQHVWITYCYEQRDGEILAKVAEKVFELERKDWCGTGKTKWVLVTPGKPFREGYGMAYEPDKVYATRDGAVIALRERVAAKVNAWKAALEAAW